MVAKMHKAHIAPLAPRRRVIKERDMGGKGVEACDDLGEEETAAIKEVCRRD
jgi:hypothetical protein